MNDFVEKKVRDIQKAAESVFDELEAATSGDAAIEDIEGAKALASNLLDQYNDSLNGLELEDREEVKMKLNYVVEGIREKLVLLKEAPE